MSKTNVNQLIPQVGIFWLYRHKIIFAHKVSLADGVRYGNAITGIKAHADYWKELRAKRELAQLPTELQDEYFSILRGRVVYHSDTDRFFIYHGNNATKRDLAKIRITPPPADFYTDMKDFVLMRIEWETGRGKGV